MNKPLMILSALAIAGAFATPARAGGDDDDLEIEAIEVRDDGASLTVEGEIEGLDDDDDVTVILRARGDAEYRCKRRGKSKKKPDDDEVRLSGKDKLREQEIADDGTDFKVKTREADDFDVWDHRCKEVDLRDVEFTRFRLFILQDGDLLATKTCWFDAPTGDGQVSKKDFECSRTRHWDDDWDWGDWHDNHWGEEAPAAPGRLLWK